MDEVLKKLEELEINYELVKHPPVYTIEDMTNLDPAIFKGAEICKNLFLRNANGKIHYLLCCHHSKAIKMDELSKKINSTRLSFASAERLAKHLKLENGYVSPFGILNNEDKKVIVVFDKDLKGQEKVGFHPNTNKATVYLPFSDVENMIKEHGNEILYITL